MSEWRRVRHSLSGALGDNGSDRIFGRLDAQKEFPLDNQRSEVVQRRR